MDNNCAGNKQVRRISSSWLPRAPRQLRLEVLEERRLLATTYYVDGPDGNGPGGNDLNHGESLTAAFATIQRAADLAQPGDTVEIRGGIYREEVDPLSAGSDGNPITYRAYNQEEVVISGGELVTGWTPVSGMVDVWVANVNWNANNDRTANTLFVNGKLKEEARQFAENDFFDIDDWGRLKNGRLQNNASSFRVDDLSSFSDDYWNGAKIKFHVNDFTLATRTIVDFDSSSGTITLDSPVGQVSQKQDNGYYIYDTLQAVDKPGEWYKSQSDGSLYYHANPGQDPNSLDIEFKQRAFAFDLTDTDYIHVEGLEFRGVSINTSSNTDHNVYRGNRFYAYDLGRFGRFYVTGNNNVLRDNEFSNTWTSFVTVRGLRNEIINNYVHHIGYAGKAAVITAIDATELLVSHNTANTFVRSFMDGYPVRSEIAYNVFENGGNLTWDTGIFDADGSNGDSSYSIFHHNIFRDTRTRGIFEAFYGRNSNAVVHHNVFYNFVSGSDRPIFNSDGTEFRQSHHNTFISDDVNSAPAGELDAIHAVQTSYNNNLQISLARMEALGVDTRGSYNYSPADFVNFSSNDYRLAAHSAAIDTGILLPGINDDFMGAAPDPGAYEFGQPTWQAGHDFASPPTPVYSWTALKGTNLYGNGQFLQGIDDWTIVSGTPNSQDRNSWHLQTTGASLTGTFRTQSVEFTPEEEIRRVFTDLTPSTTYTLGIDVRVANKVTIANQFHSSSGSIGTGTHRLEEYLIGLSPGEWVRYEGIDFGDPGQFDVIDILHIRNPALGFTPPIDGVGIEIRLDSPTGPLLAKFEDLNDGVIPDRWRVDQRDFRQPVSGVHSIYLSTTGINGANLAIGSLRLTKNSLPSTNLLTATISSPGGQSVSSQVGRPFWELGYHELTFTTGPAATTAEISFANNGRMNAYLDRLYLIEGFATRGAEPSDISTSTSAERSLTSSTTADASNLVDGVFGNDVTTGNHPESWIQIDLQQTRRIHSILLNAPLTAPERMTNFRVSVWSDDPRSSGVELWNQDYLTNGRSLSAKENLLLHSRELARDGRTELGGISGRFVRVQLLGANSWGDNQLALGEVQVLGFNKNNWAVTDGIARQSSTSPGFPAANANDGNLETRSATEATDVDSWWQVRFPQGFSIGQIELVNHDDATYAELSNFSVSVWDEEPDAGGTKIWEKSFFSTGSVGQGESFVINGGGVGADGFTRLATAHRGRVVRVQLNGTNNMGNGRLGLADVRVTASNEAPPTTNLAQFGVASQSNDHYGDAGINGPGGFARDANDGVISPVTNFTSARREPDVWWQVDLQRTAPIDQIVLFNRVDAASRLDDFYVSVWNDDPENGGTQLWSKFYRYSSSTSLYSTSAINAGGALLINGDTTSSGLRLDQVNGGRYVRVQLLGSNILSLAEVQVWSANADAGAPITVNLAANDYDYDFGTLVSPVQAGSKRITPETTGDIYWSGHVSSRDAGTSSGFSIAEQDYVYSTQQRTLHHLIANGVWEVTLHIGTADRNRDNLRVYTENVLLNNSNASDIDTAAGQYVEISGQVSVTDNQLELQFEDLGGMDSEWVLNRLEISLDVDDGDFNNDGNVDALDLTKWQSDYSQNVDSDVDSDGDSDGQDFLIWQRTFQPAPTEITTVLIDATTGNGAFAVDSVSDAASIGGGSEPLLVAINRDRALRETSSIGRGVSVPGWEIRRVSYSGSNASIGVDGNFGFAANAGPSPGQSGQAFVNSGEVSITSTPINYTFQTGDVVDLTYLLGSDTDGGTGTAYANASLVFDEGLPTELIRSFAQTSGTGTVVNFDTSEAVQYVLPQNASTLKLKFELEGSTTGVRGLLDNVLLTVTTLSTSELAASNAATLAPDPKFAASDAAIAAIDWLSQDALKTATLDLQGGKVHREPLDDQEHLTDAVFKHSALTLSSRDSNLFSDNQSLRSRFGKTEADRDAYFAIAKSEDLRDWRDRLLTTQLRSFGL